MSPVTRLGSLVLLATLALACGGRRTASDAVVPQIALEVYNGAFFDVNVYGLPAGAGSRVRIGTAWSFTTTKLPIPNAAYRAGGSLVLQLHAIGTSRWWTTHELPMAWDLTPCLDISADASGNMSRSSFFSVATPDSLPPAGARRTVCGFINTVSDAPGAQKAITAQGR
jgi:hypothetical protein